MPKINYFNYNLFITLNKLCLINYNCDLINYFWLNWLISKLKELMIAPSLFIITPALYLALYLFVYIDVRAYKWCVKLGPRERSNTELRVSVSHGMTSEKKPAKTVTCDNGIWSFVVGLLMAKSTVLECIALIMVFCLADSLRFSRYFPTLAPTHTSFITTIINTQLSHKSEPFSTYTHRPHYSTILRPLARR